MFALPPRPPPLPPPPVQQPLENTAVQRIIAGLLGTKTQNQTQNPLPVLTSIVPSIIIITNRSAFTNNKHWEKPNNKLSKRNKNWDIWNEELIRSLSAVAPLDHYIDPYPRPQPNC
jgi:hypothetical protein